MQIDTKTPNAARSHAQNSPNPIQTVIKLA